MGFEKGDVVQCSRPMPGRPTGPGKIVQLEWLGTSAIYLVRYPDGSYQRYFEWQIALTDTQELSQSG